MTQNMINYFAYGSNMDERTINAVAPSARKVATARLVGYRLAFTRESIRWKAGVADILEYPGLSVYGVLYTISADELAGLDRKEGAPKAYQRIDVTVLRDHSSILALTYKVAEPKPLEIRPDPDYLAQILQAADAHDLPTSYRSFLKYLEAQFSAGTREDGLLLTPTTDRKYSAGEPLIRLNPCDSGRVRHGRFGALIMEGKGALGKVEITPAVSPGTCQADQTLRACIGVGGQRCFGNRVTVLPSSGKVPRWSPIQPRALVLPLRAISRNDVEKNYCVLHPDCIRVLGLQEGEFARLFVAANSVGIDNSNVVVSAISIRVFAGSASEVTRISGRVPYPDRSELYIDGDSRRQLGLPETVWGGTAVLARPALWRALSSRAVFYGLTALLGIGAFFQLLQAFEPHWHSYVDGVIALAGSGALTIALSFVDLRSRFRY